MAGPAHCLQSTAYKTLRVAVLAKPFLQPLTVQGRQLRYLGRIPESAQHPPKGTDPESSSTVRPKRQSTLDRLGATRKVKVAVLVFLAIYGTAETVFYTAWLYRYFTNKKPEAE